MLQISFISCVHHNGNYSAHYLYDYRCKSFALYPDDAQRITSEFQYNALNKRYAKPPFGLLEIQFIAKTKAEGNFTAFYAYEGQIKSFKLLPDQAKEIISRFGYKKCACISPALQIFSAPKD